MRLAAQLDFYEKKYGLEKGLARVKEQGYEALVYTLPRYEEYERYSWTEEKFKEHFTNIGKIIKESGLPIAFTTTGTGLYNDCIPHTYDKRVDMCIKGVRATAYIGGKVFAVRPVKYFRGHEDGVELSRTLTYNALKQIREEAEQQGVRLAFVNSNNDYIYGWSEEDLEEITNEFDMDVILDPADAFHAGCKISRVIKVVGDKVIGVFMNDTPIDPLDNTMPFMGKADYLRLIDIFKELSPNSALVTTQALNYRKYQDFFDSEELVKALDELYFAIGSVVSGKENIL
jgi:sugar phosphate isomerase/epimerase